MAQDIEILNLTKEIASSELQDEYIVFDMFSSSLMSSLNDRHDTLEEHSYFGDEASLVSYAVLAIIAWIADDVKKEGIKLTKYFLFEYFKEKKELLHQKFNSDKSQLALKAIEQYLKNETGNEDK